MNKSLFGTALLVFAFVSVGRSSTIAYDVDLTSGAASVTGFIETDGTLGALSTIDFLNWNLEVNDGISSFDLLGPLEAGSNSSVSVNIGGASGSLAALTFDTSTSDGSYLQFKNSRSGNVASYFCAGDQDAPCGEPGLVWNANDHAEVNAFITTDGVSTIGTAATPEPSTLMLMIGALGILLLLRNRIVFSAR